MRKPTLSLGEFRVAQLWFRIALNEQKFIFLLDFLHLETTLFCREGKLDIYIEKVNNVLRKKGSHQQQQKSV